MNKFKELWKEALLASSELRESIDLMEDVKSKFSGDIYIVGGAARDILLGKSVQDVDLATNIPFDILSAHYELRNISKNDSQPVFNINYRNNSYELAAFREDSENIGRHNNVASVTNSFEIDSKRRDITINSIGITCDGELVDYQNGINDLNNGIIRAVGDPIQRFKEDATRILRVFRFAAKLNFQIEENTLEAAKELKYLLLDRRAISVESIARELYKAAKEGKTLKGFVEYLDYINILKYILPEFTVMKGMTHNFLHHPEGGSTVIGHILECLNVSPYNDPIINLSILFHDIGKGVTRGEKNGHSTYYGHEFAGVAIVEEIFKRLKFADISYLDKKKILDATANHMLVHNISSLKITTLAKLILTDSWENIKAVSFCDEASRGIPLFDKEIFEEKVRNAEEKVRNIASNVQELNQKVKVFIDGEKLLNWFPDLKEDPRIIKNVLEKVKQFIIIQLHQGNSPSEDQIRKYTKSIKNSTPHEKR
jgi:tRNA nucleotidyltransferase/poly(A) polymerase